MGQRAWGFKEGNGSSLGWTVVCETWSNVIHSVRVGSAFSAHSRAEKGMAGAGDKREQNNQCNT
jgi:hypothetical protein